MEWMDIKDIREFLFYSDAQVATALLCLHLFKLPSMPYSISSLLKTWNQLRWHLIGQGGPPSTDQQTALSTLFGVEVNWACKRRESGEEKKFIYGLMKFFRKKICIFSPPHSTDLFTCANEHHFLFAEHLTPTKLTMSCWREVAEEATELKSERERR